MFFFCLFYLRVMNWKWESQQIIKKKWLLCAVPSRCFFCFGLFFFSIPLTTQGYFPNWRLWTCCKNTLALVYEVLRQEFVTERWPSWETAAAAPRTIFDRLHQRHLVLQLHSLMITPPFCATPVFNSLSLVYINPAFVCPQLLLYECKISFCCAWGLIFKFSVLIIVIIIVIQEPFLTTQFLIV